MTTSLLGRMLECEAKCKEGLVTPFVSNSICPECSCELKVDSLMENRGIPSDGDMFVMHTLYSCESCEYEWAMRFPAAGNKDVKRESLAAEDANECSDYDSKAVFKEISVVLDLVGSFRLLIADCKTGNVQNCDDEYGSAMCSACYPCEKRVAMSLLLTSIERVAAGAGWRVGRRPGGGFIPVIDAEFKKIAF